MLNGKSQMPAASSEILQDGFYRYLLLEVLAGMQSVESFQKFTLRLGEKTSLPEEAVFSIDVEVSLNQRSCWGRLIIPNPFRKSWVQHFSQMPDEYHPSEVAKQTEIIVGIKTGSVHLL